MTHHTELTVRQLNGLRAAVILAAKRLVRGDGAIVFGKREIDGLRKALRDLRNAERVTGSRGTAQ